MKKSLILMIAITSLMLGVSCGKSDKKGGDDANTTSTNSFEFGDSTVNVTGGNDITAFRDAINRNEVKTFKFDDTNYNVSEVYIFICSEEVDSSCSGSDIKERSLSNDGTVRNNVLGSSRDEIKTRILSLIDNRTRSLRFSDTRYSVKVAGNGGEDEYIIDISVPFFMNPVYARLSGARDSYIPSGSYMRYK